MKITGTVQNIAEIEDSKYGDQLTDGFWCTNMGGNYAYVLIHGGLRILITGGVYPFVATSWQSHLFTRVTGPATLTVRIEP